MFKGPSMQEKLPIQELIKKELGVTLPPELINFLETHSECLNDNPFDRSKWKSGFGDIHFICGTTKAFRSRFPDFSKNMVIIGYVGQKEVIINHQISFIDEYIAVDIKTNEVFLVDSLGKLEKIGDSFETWIEQFISCLKDHSDTQKTHYFKDLINYLKGKVCS